MVVLLGPDRAGFILRPVPHRAELEDLERFSVQPHPHLAIEDRPAVFDPDGKGDEEDQRQEGQQGNGGDGQIESSFGDPVPSLQRCLGEIDRRQPVEIFHARAHGHELQQIGNDMDGYGLTHERVEQNHHGQGRGVWKGHEDVLDGVGLDDLRSFFDRSQAREARDASFFTVTKVADDAEAELAMTVHPLDQSAGQLAIAGDQDAIEVFASRVQALDQATHQHPPADGEGDGQHEEHPEGGARIKNLIAWPDPQQDSG